MANQKLSAKDQKELEKLQAALKDAKASKKELLATAKVLKQLDATKHERAINILSNRANGMRTCQIEGLEKEIRQLQSGTRKNYIQLTTTETGGL